MAEVIKIESEQYLVVLNKQELFALYCLTGHATGTGEVGEHGASIWIKVEPYFDPIVVADYFSIGAIIWREGVKLPPEAR